LQNVAIFATHTVFDQDMDGRIADAEIVTMDVETSKTACVELFFRTAFAFSL